MTFEEFLNKKKIDLVQFKIAEPGLFMEFQNHYSQMGEKSFDHSKKFLFNKIRRAYHLKEEPKPMVKEAIEVNELASQAEPLLSPTVEATVYTPRFRAGGTVTPKADTHSSDAPKTGKPAYTPRFKAQAAKSIGEDSSAENAPLTEETAKTAFKPRFKPGIITTLDSKQETTNEIAAGKPKPAYIPRFKAPKTSADEQPDQDLPA